MTIIYTAKAGYFNYMSEDDFLRSIIVLGHCVNSLYEEKANVVHLIGFFEFVGLQYTTLSNIFILFFYYTNRARERILDPIRQLRTGASICGPIY